MAPNKNKIRTAFIIFCILLPVGQLFAQLHGTYTIDKAKPASATNYQDFQSAINDLADGAKRLDFGPINGPNLRGAVFFNVADGIYPGQIIVWKVDSASAANTITFQSASGDSSKVIVTDSANYTNPLPPDLVVLIGSRYVKFKGISFSRSAQGNVIKLSENAGHVSFENDMFSTYNNSSSNVADDRGNSEDDSFVHNHFKHGGWGINLLNSVKDYDSNFVICNNIFENIANAIFVNQSVNLDVSGNRIIGISDSIAYGIYLSGALGPALVKANVIDLRCNFTSSGICVQSDNEPRSLGNDTEKILVSDNMVSLRDTANNVALVGLNFAEDKYTDIIYNTVLIDSKNTGSLPLQYGYGDVHTNRILNNDFVNLNGKYSMELDNAKKELSDTFDYNNYSANNGLVLWTDGPDSQIINDLKSLDTADGFDHHSISVLPTFVSDSDLHTKSYVLHGKGVPFAAVPNDIDGKPRDKVHPDIGANELMIKHDFGLYNVKTPTFAICENAGLPVRLAITNYGSASGVQIPVYFKVNNISDSGMAFQYPDTIKPDGSDTFIVSLNVHLPDTGRYTVLAYVNQDSDENRSNDTIHYSIRVVSSPKPSFTFSKPCVGQPVSFTNNTKSDSSIKYRWSFGDGDSSYQKDTSHAFINDTIYKVVLESINSIGCTDTVSLQVNPLPLTYSSFKFETVDSNVQFIVDDSSFRHYKWDFGDGDTSSLVNPSHTYKQDKIYIVTLNVKNANECIDSVEELVDMMNAGLNGKKTKAMGFSVYPNPSSHFITLHYQIDKELPVQIVLYNSYGIALKEIVNASMSKGAYSCVIDAKELGIFPGVYYVRFSSGASMVTERILFLK